MLEQGRSGAGTLSPFSSAHCIRTFSSTSQFCCLSCWNSTRCRVLCVFHSVIHYHRENEAVRSKASVSADIPSVANKDCLIAMLSDEQRRNLSCTQALISSGTELNRIKRRQRLLRNRGRDREHRLGLYCLLSRAVACATTFSRASPLALRVHHLLSRMSTRQ
jgi:hypothetical protein